MSSCYNYLDPTYIPTTSLPTTTMYTTERATTTVTWSMSSTLNDLTTMDMTTTTLADDDDSSTTSPSVATQITSSVPETTISETTLATADLTTRIIATSEIRSTAASSTTSVEVSAESTTNIVRTIPKLTATLSSSDESTPVFNDLDTSSDTITVIGSTEKDQNVANSAQNSGANDPKVTIAISIVVALLAVTGVIVVIIVIVVCSKKQGKNVGRYSPTNRQPHAYGNNEQIAPNGVGKL